MIDTDNNSWSLSETINMADIASSAYVYKTPTVQLPRGTVVKLYVNGSQLNTYTVN